MNEEIFDREVFFNILDFSVEVIEFFKNDFNNIKLFLLNNSSVWDKNIMLKLSISDKELINKKEYMLQSILTYYYDKTVTTDFDNITVFKDVDSTLIYLLQNGKNLLEIFNTYKFYNIKMLRDFIELIKDETTIKIDTFNYYKEDIKEIYNLVSFYKTSSNKQYFDKISDKSIFQDTSFYNMINKEIQIYIKHHFTTIEEKKNFINYLFSLYYLFLINSKGKENKLTNEDKKIIEIIELDKDLYNYYNDNKYIGVLLAECIYYLIQEKGIHYDFRRKVKNKKAQHVFNVLDENYGTIFEPDIILNDYMVDKKITKLLNYFKLSRVSLLTIYNVLTNGHDLSELLYPLGLDSRFSDFYIEVSIRKIIGDVFEFESYVNSIDGDHTYTLYEYLKRIPKDSTSLLNFFIDNGITLLEIYYNYHAQNDNILEKARLNIYHNKELKIMDQINIYSMANYFSIFLGKLKSLPSVDYMNMILDKLRYGNGLDNQETNIHLICLNVYERLLLEKNENIIINIIENEKDLTKYLLMHKELLKYIIDLFKTFNGQGVSYSTELTIRNNITSDYHKKILKKINPFDKEDNSQK